MCDTRPGLRQIKDDDIADARAYFTELDANGDGKIDLEEVSALLHDHNVNPAVLQVQWPSQLLIPYHTTQRNH